MKASPKLQLATPSNEQTPQEVIVDEYGKLWCEVECFKQTPAYQAFKLSEKRVEVLKEKVVAWYANLPADQTATASGRFYSLAIWPREEQRKVLVTKLFKFLGKLRFLALCGFTLKALESEVGAEEAPKFIITDRTGSRKITAAPMSQAA